MKSHDEIKKGLECLTKDNAPDAECEGCPYFEELGYLHWSCHRGKIWADTFVLIQQLQADNAQQARCIENMTDKLNAMNDEAAKLQAENAQLLRDVHGKCGACKWMYADGFERVCDPCLSEIKDNFEWRGVQKEG